MALGRENRTKLRRVIPDKHSLQIVLDDAAVLHRHHRVQTAPQLGDFADAPIDNLLIDVWNWYERRGLLHFFLAAVMANADDAWQPAAGTDLWAPVGLVTTLKQLTAGDSNVIDGEVIG